MKEQTLNDKIFSVSGCPDASDLFSFSKGELQDNEALQIEKHIADCSLCEDALEGMLLISGTEVLDEVREQNKYAPDFHINKHKFIELKIVLSATILVIATFIFLYFNKPVNDKQIVEKENAPLVTHKIQEKQNVTTVIQEQNAFAEEQVIVQKEKNVVTTKIATDTVSTVSNYPAKKDSNLLLTADATPKIAEEKNIMRSSSGLQVIYIHELKAIDYTSFYDELNQRKTGLFTGVSPQFENEKSKSAVSQSQSLNFDTITYKKILNDALLLYHENKFTTAQHSFQKILSIYPDDQNGLFYYGLCFYQLEKPEQAIKQLEKILSHRQSPFKEEAMWYSALSNHQNKNDEMCKQLLEKIIVENSFYKEKAKELLRELK